LFYLLRIVIILVSICISNLTNQPGYPLIPLNMPNTAPTPARLPNEVAQRGLPTDIVPADRLFQGSQEILIGHNGDTYRLRITKNGKLILTK